ncbi:MAG: hypothetical protein QOF04_2827, partial [Solirubrobacteraceae bacterium]|nr:hypothetical protein [Solirubrobacteraceae bacterium]
GDEQGSATALVLVGALAIGVILASDVFASSAAVDQLLFGSLLLTGPGDLALAAVASAAALLGTVVLGRRWLATGFDAPSARAQGLRSPVPDIVLLALVALAAVAALRIAGALLGTALIVVPAATTRLVLDRLPAWQLATVGLVLAEGAVGLWASVQLNVPPGPAIAVLAASVFALVAVARIVVPQRRRGAALAAAAAALALGAAGCGGDDWPTGSATDTPLRVVATTTQLGDFARQVGGPAVQVTQLMQPNSDPHDYEPRPDDVVAVGRADLILRSGGEVDDWLTGVLQNAGGAPIVAEVASERPYARTEPHWWHDPRNAEYAVSRIEAVLAEARPAARRSIADRAAAATSRIRALDTAIARCMDAVPRAQRKLVTDHEAFGAFAARYGIQVVGAVIPARTTQAEPSAGDLSRLTRLIRRERVRAVFPESSVNPRVARAIARQTGASARYTLYGDTLGPKGSDGATYVASEAHNADAMVRGFTGGSRGCPISLR